MLFIAVVAQFFCGMASVTSASRMMFAFSRDGAVPGHQLWRRLRGPRAGQRRCCDRVLAFLLMVPATAGSTSTIGYLAYRRYLDRHHRPLHRLRDPGLPAAPRRATLRARARGTSAALQVDRHRSRACGSAFIAMLFILP